MSESMIIVASVGVAARHGCAMVSNGDADVGW
jgi:hypothetical protein